MRVKRQTDWVMIPLSGGYFAKIDSEDFDRVRQHKWSANRSGPAWVYAQCKPPGSKHVYLHRFILGARDGVYVDHANGDTLDCRKANLREASPRQNACNSPQRARGTSGFRGVKLRASGRYQVQIKDGQRLVTVGRFDDPVVAARAYDAKARELHGEFAVLNFPHPDQMR